MIIFKNENAETVARGLARGAYQIDLVSGRATWSGSDLKGKRGAWGSSYHESRRNLADRLRAAGLTISEDLAVVDGMDGRKRKILIVE